VSLPSPTKLQMLQKSLHAKAKHAPQFRFYSLWDKIYRQDVLEEAYKRCRANGGAAGVDGETFSSIESRGRESWLRQLAKELQEHRYVPAPLRRVWIPKADGTQRPLGIPTIRCRVVQMAMTLILDPIFEADLVHSQYGYRIGLDAKMAVRRIFFHITQYRRTEVVDADLRDYFGSIPHGPLLKSVARRVSDGSVLALLKAWLEAPVQEDVSEKKKVITTQNKDSHRGTCQGGNISPLLANIYFRRFLLGWEKLRGPSLTGAAIVSYADDFVICCKPGTAQEALETAETILSKIGLKLNSEKTRIAALPADTFDFLGYSFGRFYGRDGRPSMGTRPSRKSISKVKKKIHDATARNTTWENVDDRIKAINAILRGWGNYFDQGPVQRAYREVNRYTCPRVQKWLAVKFKTTGKSQAKHPASHVYGKLGLYELPEIRADRAKAKARDFHAKAGCVRRARPV
jgi:RNA-directed DNA polymerase